MNKDLLLSEKLDIPEVLHHLYHPRSEPRTTLPENAVDLDIPLSDPEAILGCRLHFSSKEDPTIIYYHGNGETVGDYDNIAGSFTRQKLNVLFATYRGYGWSTGVPQVSSMHADTADLFRYALNYLADNGFSGPVFLMGRSLGSASAIDLAYRFQDDIKGLIIDSGFAETLPLFSTLGIDTSRLDVTEPDCFNNVEKIKLISKPTILFHGARDHLIPLADAEKLHAESGAKTKHFHVIPGADHNSLFLIGGELYFETILKFIDTVTGKNTWRDRRRKFKKNQ